MKNNSDLTSKKFNTTFIIFAILIIFFTSFYNVKIFIM